MQLSETVLFKTSCISTVIDWNYSNALLNELEKIKLIHKDNSVIKSNVGGFQTINFKNTNYDNEVIKILFENYIKPCAKATKERWGIPCDMENLSYWYNINYPGSFNKEHVHHGSFLSGVFYLKVPLNSGRIVFNRSSNEYDRMYHVWQEFMSRNIQIDNPEINTEHWFDPFPNLLLLFPGHVSHFVEQNNTTDIDNERVSVSFNFIN